MLAKQVSKEKEVYCTADSSLAELFNKMTELNCRCMPIVESPVHKNIIGAVTEHDICLKIITGGLNPQRTSAGRVMNCEFTTVSGEESLEHCAELLRLTPSGRLFVVDDNGAFIGVLTENEISIPDSPVAGLDPRLNDYPVPAALSTQIQLSH